MTLDEIKNEWSQRLNNGHGNCCKNWKEYVSNNDIDEEDITEIAERYAQSQTQELTDWKESMMKVHNELDLQGIGKVLELRLGSSIAPQVLPKVKELIEQNMELTELVQRCRDVIYAYNDYRPTATGNEILQAIQERLTKYNNLNQM